MDEKLGKSYQYPVSAKCKTSCQNNQVLSEKLSSPLYQWYWARPTGMKNMPQQDNSCLINMVLAGSESEIFFEFLPYCDI